jgi:cell division protein FtsB
MFFIEKHIIDNIIIMRNFQGKKTKRRFFHSWFVLFILLVFLVFFIYGVATLFNKMQETSKNKKIAEERLLLLENRKQKLILDIDELNNDKGKERVFREDYGLAREGEGVVVIIDDKNNNIEEIEPENKGFFNKVKDFLSL